MGSPSITHRKDDLSPAGAWNQKPGTFLVGRDEELAQLQRCWAQAIKGERQIVFVSGEAGIGKTALVDAFVESLRGRPEVRIASGQCVEQYGAGEAYLPLLEVVSRLCQGPSRERRIEALKRYAPSLLLQLPGLLDPADHAILQKRVQETSRERMLREFAQAAELFTVQRGLVIVLEDLHWSDVATLDWLRYTAQRREPAKLMVIGTYRPADVSATNHPLRAVLQELQGRQQCEEIRLAPLGEVAITAFLTRRFGELPEPSVLAGTLAHRTGGNPLFLVNTVDYLVEQQVVTNAAGQWTVHADTIKVVNESIPETLRQLIERQIERLSEEDRRMLEAASVVGMEFSVAEVAAGLPGDREALESQCERLAHTGQFLRTTGIEEWPDGTLSGRYSFLHAVYQEVITARVSGVRRIQWHRRIAERKETAYAERTSEVAAELAVHFAQGREYAKAVQYHEKAGQLAMQQNAAHEAITHFTKSLSLLQHLPESTERAQQELTLHEAKGCFLKALEVAQQQHAKSLELRAAMSLARLWHNQDKDDDARELLQEIYDWFTEGFGTKDLQEAEALLVSLGGSKESQKSKFEEPEGVRRKAEGLPESSPSSLQPITYSLPQSLPSPAPNPPPPTPNTFRSEGEYWTVVFQGTTARIKDTRGMQHLAQLLQHPDQEFSAIALAADSPDPEANPFAAASLTGEHRDPALATVHVSGLTDAGEMLDPQAKAEYRQRLKEIQAELEEAREFNDAGRIEKLQDELEFITQELVGAVGLRGRVRKAASPQERARVNVTRAIRIAIARVTEVHPALGQHLTQTIKTGTFCAYVSALHTSITWQF